MTERTLRELDGEITQIDGRDGVFFDCPCCTPTHGICATWSGPSLYPSGAVWRLEGEPNLDELTLTPSIDCSSSGHCTFHGWVQGGKVRW